MSDRDEMLALLPDSAGGAPPGVWKRERRFAEGLWEKFEKELNLLGGRMATMEDLNGLKSELFAIDPSARDKVASFGFPIADSIWGATVGVSMVACAVAETGTLVVEASKDDSRLVSLAPTIHVALVPDSRIVAMLDEAIPMLSGRSAAFITGPSRTADIEGVLIRGVHGPKEVWVIRLPC